MKIMAHDSLDWCHVCGKRSAPLADITYANIGRAEG